MYKRPSDPGSLSSFLPQKTFLFSPARESLVGQFLLLRPQALVAPPLARVFSPGLIGTWLWEAQKLDSFTPKQKAFDGGGPGKWSPDWSQRPSSPQFSQGDFQKPIRTEGSCRIEVYTLYKNVILCPLINVCLLMHFVLLDEGTMVEPDENKMRNVKCGFKTVI